jgi:germination protein M
MRRLTIVVVGALVVAGCGKSSHSSAPTSTPVSTVQTTSTSAATTSTSAATTSTSTSTTEATTLLRIYFLHPGKIGPVARNVLATQAVGSAALEALQAGPTAVERANGFRTALPADQVVSNLRIANGVATIDLADNVSHAGLAQIVYTLTQFPSVKAVRPSRSLGGPTSFTRADFEDLTPAILVESPLPEQAVTSPLEVRGTANTFEATFDLELRNSSGVRVAWRFVTATSGSGQRGTFDTTISFPRTGGPLTLVAYESSAASGRPIHVVRIPLQEG